MWFLLTNMRNNWKKCTATSAKYSVIIAPIESHMCIKRFSQLRVDVIDRFAKKHIFKSGLPLSYMLTTYLCIKPVFCLYSDMASQDR